MTIRRTWWVKLRRAKKHLVEFQTEFDRLRQEKRPYPITLKIEPDNDGWNWLMVYGHIPPFDADDIAAILGDVIFNARSALDHICVALTRNDDAQFPIFAQDIWKPDYDPSTGKDRNKKRRDTFKAYTKGMPVAALAIIKGLQPYAKHPQWPESDALAIFNRLSNADKHRTLFDFRPYLSTRPGRPTDCPAVESSSVNTPRGGMAWTAQ